MPDLIESHYTVDMQIQEVRREIAMRQSVYPNMVKRGRMKFDMAEQRIQCMQAVLETLQKLKGQE